MPFDETEKTTEKKEGGGRGYRVPQASHGNGKWPGKVQSFEEIPLKRGFDEQAGLQNCCSWVSSASAPHLSIRKIILGDNKMYKINE